MGLSHVLFPEMYKAYYKMSRGELLPRSFSAQVSAQKQLLQELVFVLETVKYSTESNASYKETHLETLRSLPIRSYEDLYPWIERAWNGEENVLWIGQAKCFAKSSGTTNARSKYLPVTEESLNQNHLLAGRDMLACYLDRTDTSRIGFDSLLTVSGSIQEVNPKSGITAGDVSALIDANSPWWTRLAKTLPKSIIGINSWQDRLPKVLEFAHDSDVKAFVGVTSWIHTIINESVKKYSAKNALEIWPNLEVFFHGGVSIDPYLESLKKLIPNPNFKYVEVYNASEGFFAFQDKDTSDLGMLLLTGHGIFYEFRDIKNNEIFTISDIKKDTNYELIITTVSGLWRYSLGDVVRITSTDPVRIKVVGRTKACLNTYGEELMVGNVDEAIKYLNNSSYSVREYTGSTVYKNETTNGAHEWIIEFEIVPENKDDFIQKFDAKLRELNSDYDAKRKGDIILSRPIVHFVKTGTFYNWMQSKNKLGGQNKIPRLKEGRDILESILEFIK